MLPTSHTPDDAGDRTLRDLLRTEGALPFDRAAHLLAGVTAELAALHASGRVHGAITPQSIRIDEHGTAHLGTPAADPDAVGLLPPAYVAPERIDGEHADARSDVYTLGLIGWEMLAGETPFAADSLREIVALQQGRDLPRLTTLRPGVPRPLLFAIEGALHKQPGDRWANAGEMLQQLRQGQLADRPSAVPVVRSAAEPVMVGAAAPAAVGSSTHWRQPAPVATRWGRRVGVVALVLCVLAAGVAGLVAMQGKAKGTPAAPWLDSLTTSSSAGLVVTRDTTNGSSAGLRANPARVAAERTEERAVQALVDSVNGNPTLPPPRPDSVRRVDSARRATPDTMRPDTAPARIPDTSATRVTLPTVPPPDTLRR